MEEGYVDINFIQTRIITIGGWIDRLPKNRDLIVVIPGIKLKKMKLYNLIFQSISFKHLFFYYICLGNPGLIGYYEKFMTSLYAELRGEYVIWGLGHAGHEVPPSVTFPSVNGKIHLSYFQAI